MRKVKVYLTGGGLNSRVVGTPHPEVSLVSSQVFKTHPHMYVWMLSDEKPSTGMDYLGAISGVGNMREGPQCCPDAPQQLQWYFHCQVNHL